MHARKYHENASEAGEDYAQKSGVAAIKKDLTLTQASNKLQGRQVPYLNYKSAQ